MKSCTDFGKSFTRRDALLRHQRESCLNNESVPGPSNVKRSRVYDGSIFIDESVPGPSNVKRSRVDDGSISINASRSIRCNDCGEDVASKLFAGHLRSRIHKANLRTDNVDDNVIVFRCAFKTRIVSYRVSSPNHHIFVQDFMNEVKQKVIDLVSKNVVKFTSVKINVELYGSYILEAKQLRDVKSFNTKNVIVTLGTDVGEIFDEFTDVIDQKVSEFQERDSGWIVERQLFLEVNINKYNPLRASSYIPLPKMLEKKKAIINIQNDDECCFGWAITSAVVPPKGASNRTTSYPHFSTVFDFEGMTFPVRLSDISKFESRNVCSINVYGTELVLNKGSKPIYEIVGPLYYTKNKKDLHINLLLLTDLDGNSHYCFIKKFSRLVSSQLTARNGAKYFCDGCLNYFRTEDKLSLHCQYDCGKVYVKLPTTEEKIDKTGTVVPRNVLKFDNYQKQLQVPFVIYADFETMLKPIHTTEPSSEKSFSVRTCEHEPYSFGYYIKCAYDDSLSKLEVYRGKGVAQNFMQRIETDVRYLYDNHLKVIKTMQKLTQTQKCDFEDAKACHICEKSFDDGDTKVQDHCHLTGVYRGAAHQTCNLNFKLPNFVPVFFHNLTGYDSHLFIKELAMDKAEIDVIALNKEKYISFSKYILVDEVLEAGKIKKIFLRLRFLDSYRFMSSSLDKLSRNLESHQCVEIRKYFGDDIKFNLMRQKGIFRYSYIETFSKLSEETLPTLDQFYDKLRGENVSPVDYQRARDVWNVFQCKTLGDYSDVYLKSDVLLLANVFENFRKVCIQNYKLDPAQYYTAPGLSWDAMLKNTKVELELLTDLDMVHFFKSGIRGGVSMCSGRKAIANNQYLPNFDPTKAKSFILYLDATNLYGYAMRQYLPCRNFSWLTSQECENFNVLEVPDESDVGYVLEVDLKYPTELHNLHNDFPFCPELVIPPHSKGNTPKLIPNLTDKTKYTIHYRNLKQCLLHGLKLTKIHRILKFEQSPWLRQYIDMNTRFRNAALNEFEKDFFKLMNNGIFGKTMENVDNRVIIKLVSHWNANGKRFGAQNYISKPNFKALIIFSEDLVAIELGKVSVLYDKPVYAGFSILDISKTVMYEFYYDFLKSRYNDNVSLLYTDTDSLIVNINTEDVYSDIRKHIDRFDTSNYKVDNVYKIPCTSSVVGKMKDEYAGVPIRSFYGVSAKAYCVNAGDKLVKKAKGVKKHSIDTFLKEEHYRSVVESENKLVFCKMYVFKSSLHNMYTELKNKVALASKDDKRFIIPNTSRTLAWGHEDIWFYQDTDSNLDTLVKMLINIRDEDNVTSVSEIC